MEPYENYDVSMTETHHTEKRMRLVEPPLA